MMLIITMMMTMMMLTMMIMIMIIEMTYDDDVDDHADHADDTDVDFCGMIRSKWAVFLAGHLAHHDAYRQATQPIT